MKDELHIIINARVRESLKVIGKNQEWLAAEAQIDKAQLSQILNCKDNKRWDNQKLERAAAALAVPAWTLLVDPKAVLDEFDRELASRFHSLTSENKKKAILEDLGFDLDNLPIGALTYTQSSATLPATVHEKKSGVKTNFEEMPDLKKGKKK